MAKYHPMVQCSYNVGAQSQLEKCPWTSQAGIMLSPVTDKRPHFLGRDEISLYTFMLF